MQNETRLKRMSAVITLVLGALLLLAAWRKPPEMIIWLNLLAFGGLEAVFLWPLVLALLGTRQRQRRAKCDDRWRRAVCRTRDAEYSVPGLPPLSCPRYY
ncbi:sodium:solute symporter family transporter [Escherichia coli]